MYSLGVRLKYQPVPDLIQPYVQSASVQKYVDQLRHGTVVPEYLNPQKMPDLGNTLNLLNALQIQEYQMYRHANAAHAHFPDVLMVRLSPDY